MTVITLPENPTPGQIEYLDLLPEDMSLKFVWQGNGTDNEYAYWRVLGNFDPNSEFDDLYVKKTGDTMSPDNAYLINLDVKYADYNPNGTSPIGPQGVDPNFVSLVTRFQQSGFEVYGAFGIEDNKELPGEPAQVKILNDAVIAGRTKVGATLYVTSWPFLVGGQVGETVTYSYRWDRMKNRRYDHVNPEGRDTDKVEKAEIVTQWTTNAGLGPYSTDSTSTSDPGSGCEVNIDEINEDGLIIAFTITNKGSGYKTGEILTLSGTDAQIIVTDIIDLYSYEQEPDRKDAAWLLNSDISDKNEDFKEFKRVKQRYLAKDKQGQLVFLADSAFTLQMTQSKYPSVRLHFTSEF